MSDIMFSIEITSTFNVLNPFFFFFFLIWVLRPVKIISLILSQVNHQVGRKLEIPKKNHLNTRKQTWLD